MNTNKNKQYTIYKITNTVNGKSYIGQTVNLKHRFYKCHQNNSKMAPDIERHGIDSFKMEILASTTDKKFAQALEEHFIDKFDSIRNGYNRHRCFHNNAGMKRTPEANAKRRAAISKLVWVYNHHDLATRRVSREEAEALCTSGQGWHMGRFRRDLCDKNKQLFPETCFQIHIDLVNVHIDLSQVSGDYFKPVCA